MKKRQGHLFIFRIGKKVEAFLKLHDFYSVQRSDESLLCLLVCIVENRKGTSQTQNGLIHLYKVKTNVEAPSLFLWLTSHWEARE